MLKKFLLCGTHIWFFFFPGFGCDTEAVVNILAHRDATQRALIQQEYRVMYSDDILKRLSSELSGKLEVLTIPSRLLMTSWRQRSMEHIYFLITFYFLFFFLFFLNYLFDLFLTQILERELQMIVFSNKAICCFI